MTETKRDSKPAGRRRKRGRLAHQAEQDGLELGTDKLYFKIGEVAQIVGVEPYVLRYWEQEFKCIRPQKSRSKQRVYRRKDVETVLKVKHLLYERKFTIAGACQELEDPERAKEVAVAAPSPAYRCRKSLDAVHDALRGVRALLAEPSASPELAADPATYLQERGGAASILAEMAESEQGAQPLLERPERELR